MNGELPVECDEARLAQIRRFVDIDGYRTGLTFRLRPDQVADYKAKLTETIITAICNQWQPNGGANVYSFAQAVAKTKKKELTRHIVREHETEYAFGRKCQLNLEDGQKALLTRDWENDPELDKSSIMEELPGPFSRRAFDTLRANMDYRTICSFLTPEERRIFAALCKTGGKVEPARMMLGSKKYKHTNFHEKIVPALRNKLSKIK